MNLKTEAHTGVMVVFVREERLDAHNSEELKIEMNRLFENGTKNLLVDLKEVRFIDSGRVYARLLQTLRHHFLSTDMTMRVGPAAAHGGSQAINQNDNRADFSSTMTATLPPAESIHRQSVINWARTGVEMSSTALPGSIPSFRPFPGQNGLPGGLPSQAGISPTSAPADMAPWELGPVDSNERASGFAEAELQQAGGAGVPPSGETREIGPMAAEAK